MSTHSEKHSERKSVSNREATPLARELARARAELIRCYERNGGVSRSEALEKLRDSETSDYANHLLNEPPASTTWCDLDALAAVDPELCALRWDRMVEAASDELATGHRSAVTIEVAQLDAFPRAQYVAILRELEDGWNPRNGIERLLIDMMAQAFSMKLFWMQRMVALDGHGSSNTPEGSLAPPRVSLFHAIEQAATMTDRFDRMFLRALRQLRDFRRYMPTVVVQHADQINFAEQQINLTAGETSNQVKAGKRRPRSGSDSKNPTPNPTR